MAFIPNLCQAVEEMYLRNSPISSNWLPNEAKDIDNAVNRPENIQKRIPSI